MQIRNSLLPGIILLFYFLSSCSGAGDFSKRLATDRFIFYCCEKDLKAMTDIERTLEEHYQRICSDMQYQYEHKIIVEIYPDQAAYDKNVMSMPGSPACSGNRKMQLVSPLSPINFEGIPYEERLMMVVHEFVHLMNNEINNELPMWLEEGAATYVGSANIYEHFSRKYFKELPGLEFTKLEYSYGKIAGADIYSYTAVKFIIEKYGWQAFNRIIRNTEEFEEILKLNKEEFTKDWNSFITDNYKKK